MKVISLNIETNRHYDVIFSFIRKENPDVICMQEVLEDDYLFIKDSLALDGVFIIHNFAMSLDPTYDDVRGKRYGLAIFSKKIIDSGHCYYWGREENIRLPFEEFVENKNALQSHVLLWAHVLDGEGESYRFATTHFPVTTEGESTPHQLEILQPFFKELDSYNGFVLVGDFNAPRGNETFTRIAAKYTDAIPPHYKTSLDQNLHRKKGLMFMVDGLFHTSTYQASDVSLVDGLSDHMAIIATITKKK